MYFPYDIYNVLSTLSNISILEYLFIDKDLLISSRSHKAQEQERTDNRNYVVCRVKAGTFTHINLM